MQLIINKLREDGKFKKITLCYVKGNDAAFNLYKKCGFKLTDDVDEDGIIMELNL